MYRLLPCFFILCVALVVGCNKGSKDEPKSDQQGTKPTPERMTADNVYRIRNEEMTLPLVQQMLGGPGEPTNDEKPGLVGGTKYVWKEGNKKVYVSFDPIKNKANGVAWEGFAGR